MINGSDGSLGGLGLVVSGNFSMARFSREQEVDCQSRRQCFVTEWRAAKIETKWVMLMRSASEPRARAERENPAEKKVSPTRSSYL